MRIRAGSICFLLVALGSLGGLASAAPFDAIPGARLELRSGDARLMPWTATWATAQGDGLCAAGVADGIPDWKPVGHVRRARAHPRIAFRTAAKPEEAKVVYGARLRHGFPRHVRTPQVRLSPRRGEDGTPRAWVARFAVRVKDRAFVDVSASWSASDGCTLGESASWDFQLKRGAP